MNELVLTGPLLAALAVAALAGLVSFASPCVLPLVPGYLGYITGMAPGAASAGAAGAGADARSARAERWRLLGGSLLFIAGFTAVFLTMSVVISSLGLTLVANQGLLLRVGGAIVIALGLVMALQPGRSWQVRWRPAAGLAGAPLLGVVFGLGFSACSGPALVAIQTLGTSIVPGAGSVGRALILGMAYCLGLGLPFLAVAAGLGWMDRATRWLRDHYLVVQRTGGALLVALGLLMVLGLWEPVTAWVQSLTASFTTVL